VIDIQRWQLAEERKVWLTTLEVLRRDRDEVDEMIAWLARRLEEAEVAAGHMAMIEAER
jgi:hypothetical protein